MTRTKEADARLDAAFARLERAVADAAVRVQASGPVNRGADAAEAERLRNEIAVLKSFCGGVADTLDETIGQLDLELERLSGADDQ